MSDCNALKVTNAHSFGKEAVRGGFISAAKIAAIHLITLMLTLLCLDKKRRQVVTNASQLVQMLVQYRLVQ